MLKKIKDAYRGYSEEDTKNVNLFIIKRLQPVIHEYVEYEAIKGHTLPVEFATDPAAWLNILRDIQYAFDWLYAEKFGEPYKSNDDEAKKTHYERIDNGCKLFGEHFRSMWN